MIRFNQPNDHRFRGRGVYVNPHEVETVTRPEGCPWGECEIRLRTGQTVRVAETADNAAGRIGDWLERARDH